MAFFYVWSRLHTEGLVFRRPDNQVCSIGLVVGVLKIRLLDLIRYLRFYSICYFYTTEPNKSCKEPIQRNSTVFYFVSTAIFHINSLTIIHFLTLYISYDHFAVIFKVPQAIFINVGQTSDMLTFPVVNIFFIDNIMMGFIRARNGGVW